MLENTKLSNLIQQSDSLCSSPMENSFEWFDDIQPKAHRLLQRIQKELLSSTGKISTEQFNRTRDCCDRLDGWIKQLNRHRKNLENQKGDMLRLTMHEHSIHDSAYSSFRGLLG